MQIVYCCTHMKKVSRQSLLLITVFFHLSTPFPSPSHLHSILSVPSLLFRLLLYSLWGRFYIKKEERKINRRQSSSFIFFHSNDFFIFMCWNVIKSDNADILHSLCLSFIFLSSYYFSSMLGHANINEYWNINQYWNIDEESMGRSLLYYYPIQLNLLKEKWLRNLVSLSLTQIDVLIGD